MAALEGDLGRAKDALRRLQMGIYYLNTHLRESFEMKSVLESLEKAVNDFRAIVSEHPDLDKFAGNYVKEQDLLPVFKEMKARYDAILTLLRKYSVLIEDLDRNLERYRSYRYYMFKEDDAIARFADALFSGRGDIEVRPVIVSGEKIGEALEKLGGEQVARLTYRFPGEKAGDIADLFLREFSNAGFVIESAKMRLTWKPEVGVVRVDCDREDIHEIDALAERLGGTALSV